MNLQLTILISLKVCFAYGSMKPGNIFEFMPRFFDFCLQIFPDKVQLYLRNPLYNCLFCCSSFWGLIFYFTPLPLWLDIILSVAGLNYLISTIIRYYHDEAEKMEPYHEEILKDEKEATENY